MSRVPTSLRTSLFVLSLVLLALPARAADDPFAALVRTTEPLAPADERAALHAPPGFDVQLFAAEPQINKPINLAFDERGRMWVSSTVEYPFPAAKERWTDAIGSSVRDSRDCIKILADSDGDGRADRVSDFASGLNIPIGVLPYGRGCIAWSIPNIWLFEDTDGDDRCDRRTVLFGPAGYERDVHGNIASLRLAPDGWVYATHGFSNITRLDVARERLAGREPGSPGTFVEMQSGNTFRFRPDGSAIEPWTRGQVNPFGLCFDRWTNLYSADCHSDPVTHLMRGVCYPGFGRPHDGLGFGPVMCPHRHGSTGLCGVVYIERGLWGPEWDETVLIGNCVTSRVNCDRVSFTGSTPHANEQPDFLTSADPWFRPVDLQLGPDGALYMADFYNRIIGHYEVDLKHPGRDRERGRIWRVARSGVKAAGLRPLSKDEALAQDVRWRRNAKGTWSTDDYDQAFALAYDDQADARVRRLALEGIAFRAELANLPRLLTASPPYAADDTAFRQTWRVALRNHLQLADGLERLTHTENIAVPADELQRVVRAVGTPPAAEWLFAQLRSSDVLGDDPVAMLTFLASQLPGDSLSALVDWVRTKPKSPEVFERLQALRQGLALRGSKNTDVLADWAAELAAQRVHVAQAKPAQQTLALTQAAELVEQFKLDDVAASLVGLIDLPELSPEARQAIAVALARFPAHRQAIGKAFAAAPTRVQLRIAETLVGSRDGATELVALAPASLLVQPTIAPRLASWHDAQLEKLVRERTQDLPSISQDVEKVLKGRLKGFDKAKRSGRFDAKTGEKLFVQHCAACHKIGTVGQMVGPQLDGVRNRGAERLCEDILDPSRAVDPMFRMHVLVLDDGTIVNGLVRREEPAALVVADQTGKERTVAKSDVEQRSISPQSLMPSGFATAISESDFYQLLGWLLEH